MKQYSTALLALGIMMAFVYRSHAQKVIPVEDRMLRDSIGENATRNTKQLGYLQLIKQLTKKTKDHVESTQQLQQHYREFLRQTTSTASLTVANQEAGQKAFPLIHSTADRLGDYGFAHHLHTAYNERAEPLEKSQRLYEQLIPYDATGLFSDLTAFTAYQQARRLNVTALEEMSERRKRQLAKAYQQLAEQKISQASELRQQLTGNRHFSMTEAERLALLRRMQDDLLSSQQLKTQADQLIRLTGSRSFSKQQVLNSFRHTHERKAIATTPVF